MLSIKPMSPDHAGYYLSLAREDYYLQGGEPPGIWIGKAADAIGLNGYVDHADLHNLFRGYAPDGSKPIVQLQRHEGQTVHRPGFDLTFSAPKSASVLWSQASPEYRHAIQEAQFRAVQAGIAFIEESVAVARSGKGGHVAERAGLIAASFEHGTSRDLDPQLHTHVLVMNAALRSDGRFSTLNGTPLLEAKMAAGAIYRVELAYQMERLGLQVRRESSWFEVKGVSQGLMTFFSKRREEIEQELLRTGLQGAEAAAAAALVTRQTKEATSRANQFQAWQEEGESRGWSTQQADSLFHGRQVQHGLPDEIEQCRARALERITAQNAYFSELEFIRYFAEEAQGRGLDAAQTRGACADAVKDSQRIVPLGERYGHQRFTTPEMLDLERKLLTEVDRLDKNESHRISAETCIEFLSRHPELYEEQMKALYHVTVDTGGVAIVSGVAGSGKTYMLGRAKELWEAEGYEVLGTALAGRAARQLADESGIKCRTIAKLLNEVDRGRNPLHNRSILVVDEAGMLDSATWERLTRLCNESGAKLCATGHEAQLQPIGPGAPLPELAERYRVSRLVDNRRQRDEWLRDVVGHMLEGKADPALKALVAKGMVSIYQTKGEAVSALVRKWRDDGYAPADTLILAGTRRDVANLNFLAHEAMIESGKLSGTPIEIGGEDFLVGDRVRFTKTSGPRGIENGTRGTIVATDPASERITVQSDLDERISVSVRDFPFVARGYASTTHSAQGASVKHAYLLPGGNMQDRELSYVQASRAKWSSSFFLTEAESGQAIAEFSRQIKRSRQKEMAVAVERANQPQREALDHAFDQR